MEETDWHRLEKERFAKGVADQLRTWALSGHFDALVLAADPKTLAVQDRLVGEINKDLTRLPVRAIERVLNEA